MSFTLTSKHKLFQLDHNVSYIKKKTSKRLQLGHFSLFLITLSELIQPMLERHSLILYCVPTTVCQTLFWAPETDNGLTAVCPSCKEFMF